MSVVGEDKIGYKYEKSEIIQLTFYTVDLMSYMAIDDIWEQNFSVSEHTPKWNKDPDAE